MLNTKRADFANLLTCRPLCTLHFERLCVTLPDMLGSSSVALRVVRSITALITMWCLGCSSYEPMLSTLFASAGSAGMSCDGNGGMEDVTSAAPSAPSDSPKETAISAAANGSQHSISCSCQSCHAASPTALGVATAPPSPARPPLSTLVNFLSVEREPLVPPPDAVSHRA